MCFLYKARQQNRTTQKVARDFQKGKETSEDSFLLFIHVT